MTEQQSESEFDDPGFKAAVRRTIGHETAPPTLRATVTSLLAAEAASVAVHADADAPNGKPTAPSEQSPASSPSSSRGRGGSTRDRSFWRTLAAAACVLLALGFMAYEVRESFFPPRPYAGGGLGGAVTAVPASLVKEMASTHDKCAALPDHHKIPGNDPVALREKLTAGAGVSVSAINMGSEWTFKGAGLCQVGDKQAAHLLFVRADEYLSIFSMSAPEECGYGGDTYKDIYEKHVVTGFRHGDALYCVVGSSATREMTKNELDPVLQKVQESISAGASASTAGIRQP